MSIETISATSELEAVNQLLAVIGETPVNSLDETQSPSVPIAKDEIKRTSRKVQAEGLTFNTEKRTLTPDEEHHEITLPSGTLRIYPVDPDKRVVWRGDKLYDKDKLTYEFNEEIEVVIIIGMDFEDLPEHVRQYIVVRAGRIFHDRMVGSELLHSFTKQDEVEAKRQMYLLENVDTEEIRKAAKEILMQGFTFNTDYEYKLKPGATKTFLTNLKKKFQTEEELDYLVKSDLIRVPENTLYIKPSDRTKDIVVRGGALYDRQRQSFKFTSPVKVDIVWDYEYRWIPEHVKKYIEVVATIRFEKRVGLIGEEHTLTYTQEDLMRARSHMLAEEAASANHNYLSSPISSFGSIQRGRVR